MSDFMMLTVRDVLAAGGKIEMEGLTLVASNVSNVSKKETRAIRATVGKPVKREARKVDPVTYRKLCANLAKARAKRALNIAKAEREARKAEREAKRAAKATKASE